MDVIWYKNSNFISKDNFLVFFPTPDMSMSAKLNAVMRLTIYFGLLTLLVTQDIRVIYIVIFVGLLTVGINEIENINQQQKTETFEKNNWALDKRDNRACIMPSQENPFMNVLMNEYSQDPQRPDACDVENKNVKKMMKTYFDTNVIRDTDDIFHKNASDRQFYTTPNTGIPNDQVGFARWLYSTPPTCKEGNGVDCYSQQYRHFSE